MCNYYFAKTCSVGLLLSPSVGFAIYTGILTGCASNPVGQIAWRPPTPNFNHMYIVENIDSETPDNDGADRSKMKTVVPPRELSPASYTAKEQGQNENYANIVQELKPLAEQGDAYTQYLIGMFYRHGLGVHQDYELALYWLSLAAEQGVEVAYNELGVMYGKGLGVSNNLISAHMWFYLAASHGNVRGQKNRELIQSQMSSSQIEEAQDLAREWMEMHAD